MLSTDNVILLIKAQWERGLIVPTLPGMAALRDACEAAVSAGLCIAQPYESGSGKADCFQLTREGWLRFGELTSTTIVFT